MQSCPYVYYQKVSRSLLLQTSKSIIDFCINAIKLSSYTYFLVDIYHISNYKENFKKRHKAHDIFIYGVDLKSKFFYAADNFSNGKYTFEKVSFEELLNGFNSVEELNLDDWIEGICLLSYREKNNFFDLNHAYKFDLNKLLMELQDYLTSYKTPKRYCNPYDQWMIHASDMAFGLEVYDVIIHFLENVTEIHDRRPFFVLAEHKKLMLMRIEFLQNELSIDLSNLKDKYSEIVKKTNILSMLYLKCIISKNGDIKKRLVCNLQSIRDEEEKIICNLYNLLIKEYVKV
ncbi:hypothetical protein [Paenibacillus sp. MZ03-122A]|uniref:hypothetical protein n=1 Tax=Paenibacillus sp. MZ03-122A TaxID=2962033 RepID=UPI0020B8A490|nr:hypothetical protein [Paenibacillus sp. MZ03-122A]MCP3778706.1 hypothetical protein [Paenibacillus sp. MZ03-122A]